MLYRHRGPGAVFQEGHGPVLEVMGSDLVQQGLHVAEDPIVVGDGCKYQG